MSKVGAQELKGEGIPAVLQPGPVHWALIGMIISSPVAEPATGQLVSDLQRKHQCLLPPPPGPSHILALGGWLLGILTAGASEGLFLNTVPLSPSEVNFSEPFSVVFSGREKQLQQEKPAEAVARVCSHSTPAGLQLPLPPSLLPRCSCEPKLFMSKKLLTI